MPHFRKQREAEFQRLTDADEAAGMGFVADKQFFERNSQRSFHLRPATRNETLLLSTLGKRAVTNFLWVAVKQIKSGVRIRTFFQTNAMPPDLEHLARAIFEATVLPQTREAEAVVRQNLGLA